jgi:hypothetical protein
MAHVNLLKQVKIDDRWVLRSIPKKANGQRDWSALPDGSYFIGGAKRETNALARWPHRSQALEAQHIAGGTRSDGGRHPPAPCRPHTPAGTHALSASIRRYSM